MFGSNGLSRDILNNKSDLQEEEPYSILVEYLQIIQHKRIPKYHNKNRKAGQQKVNLTVTDNMHIYIILFF